MKHLIGVSPIYLLMVYSLFTGVRDLTKAMNTQDKVSLQAIKIGLLVIIASVIIYYDFT